jgi:aspartate-semialdehyde dehydrogenase
MTYNVGVAGATGATGQVALRILEERKFPVGELRLFASRRSTGRRLRWGDREIAVEALEDGNFDGLDLVLNATSASLAREWVPRMVSAGAVVCDKSSAFRLDAEVPLVVPEINGEAARSNKGILASPNCTTAVVLMAIAPLHQAVGVRSVISSSYQSVSGVGRDAVSELIEEARKSVDQLDALLGTDSLDLPEPETFPHVLSFNVFPQCETYPEGEDTSTEEGKMQPEVRKVLDAPGIALHATAVRVPVVVGHSVSLSLELEREVSADEARRIIDSFGGVRVVDEPWMAVYPTPLQATGIDDVLVGRVRTNPVLRNGLSLFASGDNLRKGAALNAIQTAELILGI